MMPTKTYGNDTGHKETQEGQTARPEIEVVDVGKNQRKCLEPEIKDSI